MQGGICWKSDYESLLLLAVRSAVEEGSSFFSNRMMWYALVSCGMTLYVSQVLTYAQAFRGEASYMWRAR